MRLWRSGKSLAVLAAIAASFKAVLVKLAYQDPIVGPEVLLLLRMALALPFFLWLWFASPKPTLTYSQHWRLFAIGFSGYYFSSYCDFVGLQKISAGLERLVLFTYPTIILLLQAAIKKQWPSRNAWISVALCYAGLLAAMSGDLQQQQNSDEVIVGSTWVFISGVSMAVYYVVAATLVSSVGANRMTGIGCTIAAILVILHFLVTQTITVLTQLQWQTWWYAFLMAVICTVLPSWLMSLAIKRIGASQTATIGNLGPVITLLLSWIVLNEAFSYWQLFGLFLVVAGVQYIAVQKSQQ